MRSFITYAAYIISLDQMDNLASPYEIRSNDQSNGRSKKQSMAELKLRRLNELNQRLQEDLNRRRIPVSEAAIE